MVYIVYHGVITPDNCDASEGSGPYKLDICKTEAQVLKLRKEHEAELHGEDGDQELNGSNPVFRVFQGEEMRVEPIERETQWMPRKG